MIPGALEKFSLYLTLDRGLSAKTVEAYCGDVRQFLELGEPGGDVKPLANTPPRSPVPPAPASAANFQDATRADIQAYLARLSGQLENRSLSRKLSALRMFFQFAVAQGWRDTDPTTELESPKIPRSLPKTLSIDDVEKLLTAPKNPADAVMIRVLYASGLRISELLALTPDQVDTHAGLIRVLGKGDKVRIIPMDADTANLVRQYSAEIRPALLAKARTSSTGARAKQGSDAPLFLSSRGKAFTRQGFWKMLKQVARAAGIETNVSPHVLRHAFATHLLERGMNLRSLQMLLGHSDISTTEIYSHVSTAHLHETLRKHHPKGRK